MLNKSRLYLKQIREKDIPLVCELFKMENGKMLSFEYGEDLNERDISNVLVQILNTPGNRLDCLVYLKNGALVGYTALVNIDWIKGSTELVTLIDEKYLYVGFGTIIMSLVCDLCFEELNLNKIYYKIREDNYFLPSRIENKILREVPVKNDKIQSYYYGEIIKSESSIIPKKFSHLIY